MPGWNEEELIVLMAIQVNNPFSLGDDSRPENHDIAHVFGRTPAAVDRQWRNIKDYLTGVHISNVGGNVQQVVDQFRSDYGALRREARDIIDERGWALDHYLG